MGSLSVYIDRRIYSLYCLYLRQRFVLKLAGVYLKRVPYRVSGYGGYLCPYLYMATELSWSDCDALPLGLYQHCPPSLVWEKVMQRVMTMGVPEDKQLRKGKVPELVGYIHKHP